MGSSLARCPSRQLVANVTGEASTLAGLTTVQTASVDVSGVSSTVTRTVSLDLPSEITGVGEQTFQVTVTLRPTDSSRSFATGLVVVGAESNRTYSLGANSVIVTLGGGDQALNAVDAASFTASINVRRPGGRVARRGRARGTARRPSPCSP